jgi:hypothetical protein
MVFLLLVTSDNEPLTTPIRETARDWAHQHRLDPSTVAAYESTVTVPHHVLYSPQGQELLRLTAHVPADKMRTRLDDTKNLNGYGPLARLIHKRPR